MSDRIKIGIIGCGYLGKIHAKCIKEIDNLELLGVYDMSQQNTQEMAKLFSTNPYYDLQTLIDNCDLVDVVAATIAHYELARQVIVSGKHCFIEKPLTATVDEAEKLIKLAEKYNVVVQIGHVERYNPAFIGALPHIFHPFFIEAQRLCKFSQRGSDVSVVHDLMIHDIDLVLSILKSEIIDIQATGYKFVTESIDYADVKILFANDSMAHLTASRVSSNTLRKMCIFQPQNCIYVNFQEKQAEIIEFEKSNAVISKIPVIEYNAIIEELTDFIQTVQKKSSPKITLKDGYNALCVADKIVTNIFNKMYYK